MNNIVSLRERTVADEVRALAAEITSDQESNRVERMLALGSRFNWVKSEICGNSKPRFGAWLRENDIRMSKDDRAGCMNLDANPEAASVALREWGHCTSPAHVWKQVKHLAISYIYEDDEDTREEPTVTENPAPAAPEMPSAPEPTAEKTKKPEPEQDEASARKASRNLALKKWGKDGEQLFALFPHPQSHRCLNTIAGKRHGAKVAQAMLEHAKKTDMKPMTVPVERPNARFFEPWLVSPAADGYDLTKLGDFNRLMEDRELIEQVCRPIMETIRWDKSNRCGKALKQAKGRAHAAARNAQVQAMREEERKAVNTENRPPVIVCGTELWPDGDQLENDRLTYDEARFAYFFWDHWGGELLRHSPPKTVAAFVSQRSLAFVGLTAVHPKLTALVNFLRRAADAKAANPEGKSQCEPVDRRSIGK